MTYGAMCDETFFMYALNLKEVVILLNIAKYVLSYVGDSLSCTSRKSLLSSIYSRIVFDVVSYMKIVKACPPLSSSLKIKG